MASQTRTYLVIEGPIKGEAKLKNAKNKDGSPGQLVCNLGFPIDTSEQAGMEHKDCWIPTVCFGGMAEVIGKLPAGTQVHLEGHLNANRWFDNNRIEKMTIHLVIEKAGEIQGLGQPVKFFVIPKKQKPALAKDAISNSFKPSSKVAEPVGAGVQAFLDGQAASSAPGSEAVKGVVLGAEVQGAESGVDSVPGEVDGH
jgi:single-stranded DNA-binding protein